MKIIFRFLAIVFSISVLVLMGFNFVGDNTVYNLIFVDKKAVCIILFILIILSIIINIFAFYGKNYKLMIQLDAPIFTIINLIISVTLGVLIFCLGIILKLGDITPQAIVSGVLILLNGVLSIVSCYFIKD